MGRAACQRPLQTITPLARGDTRHPNVLTRLPGVPRWGDHAHTAYAAPEPGDLGGRVKAAAVPESGAAGGVGWRVG